jgi:glycosyltransferase involved in cell wall biosynthesis
MRITVIASTHQRPDALALLLRGLARQSRPADEVIISEDGEDPATRACVSAATAGFPGRLVHLGQPHRGFRLSRVRNRGLAIASGDYVILMDGDQIPSRTFIADHEAFARIGHFTQGSRVLAGPRATARLLGGGLLDASLLEPDLDRRRHLLRVPALWWLFSRPNQLERALKGCNLAFWREDLVKLNGFEEQMVGWGLEDLDLCARAYHLGLWRRNLRLGAGVIHLWHGPPGRLTDDNPNWPTYRETLATRRVRAVHGLDGHIPSTGAPAPSSPTTPPASTGGRGFT